jgi:hypothetical protein
MSVPAALVLGFFLLLAALVHEGVYTAGHDFVVNRFTGTYEFVPGEDGDEWSDEACDARAVGRSRCTLTSLDPAARFGVPHRRR